VRDEGEMPERVLVCPICGARTERLIDGLCPDCYVKHHPMVEQKKAELTLKICKKCGRLGYKGSWSDTEEELLDQIRKDLKHIVKFRGEIRDIDIKIYPRQGSMQLTVTGKVHPEIQQFYQEEYEIPAKMEYTICDACLGRVSKAKRAIVQVRASNRELTQREKNILLGLLEQTASMKGKGTDLSPWQVKEESGGFDLYFSTISAAKEFVNNLSHKMYFDTLETGKKVGVDSSGQEKFQVTFRLLLPGFTKGDVIKYRDRYYLVKDIDSKRVFLLDLDSYVVESVVLLKSFISQTSTVARASEIQMGIIVAVENEKVYVMDKDYKVYEVNVKKSEGIFRIEDKVGILFHEGKIILVPLQDK
jgi:nonsense-mediated mRNA decay protein 3